MSQLTLPEFSDKVSEIMPAIMREFIKQQSGMFYKTRMTVPQSIVLEILHRNGETRMTDLANFMNVTTAAMTGIVSRIVRDGYCLRISDPEDRRTIKIRLTPKGERIVKTISEDRKKVTMKIFGMISQKEREEYLGILMHIKEHLKQE